MKTEMSAGGQQKRLKPLMNEDIESGNIHYRNYLHFILYHSRIIVGSYFLRHNFISASKYIIGSI